MSDIRRLDWPDTRRYNEAFDTARAAGFPGYMAGQYASRLPNVTEPFPWRAEIKGPDDARIVCGEFGNPSTFATIAECHSADDARWIVAVCNAFVAHQAQGVVTPPETPER
jgi:hypothetical protein